MNAFWRETPLTEEEAELYNLVIAAHARSAQRGNPSSEAVALAAVGSNDYFKSLAAGLMTLGGLHGPIIQTAQFLAVPNIQLEASERLNHGQKIPGWGNSFIKGRRDDLWSEVDVCLKELFVDMHLRFGMVTEMLHVRGKDIYPNPSAYTAGASLLLGLPAPLSAFLLVAGRLAAWSQIAGQFLKE